MSTQVWGLFATIGMIILLVFTYSFQKTSVADVDNETAVQNAARNAMTEAVNLGNQRVNEEVTINEEVAVEATIRMYAASSTFGDVARYINIFDVNSAPAYIAVDSYAELQTPIRGMLKKYNDKVVERNDFTRSRDVVIYEAKDIIKPPIGE